MITYNLISVFLRNRSSNSLMFLLIFNKANVVAVCQVNVVSMAVQECEASVLCWHMWMVYIDRITTTPGLVQHTPSSRHSSQTHTPVKTLCRATLCTVMLRVIESVMCPQCPQFILSCDTVSSVYIMWHSLCTLLILRITVPGCVVCILLLCNRRGSPNESYY